MTESSNGSYKTPGLRITATGNVDLSTGNNDASIVTIHSGGVAKWHDDQTSIVDVVYNSCRFFAHESCGQCTPCREGTGWMLKMLERMRRGLGRLELGNAG